MNYKFINSRTKLVLGLIYEKRLRLILLIQLYYIPIGSNKL